MGIVDNSCRCCDCLNGQMHGFNLAKLQDVSSFTVKFSRAFQASASNPAKPGMSARCRFKQPASGDTTPGQWCCMATNSWLGFTNDVTANVSPLDYGVEQCNAYTGNQNPEGINFWGVNYHFKEYHRCVTPSAHHVCGENVQAIKSKKQDIGHLPYFDQNDLGQYAGFTVLVNSFYTQNTDLSGYTAHADKLGNSMKPGCLKAIADQMGGIHKQHVLTANDCAQLCDEWDICKGSTSLSTIR